MSAAPATIVRSIYEVLLEGSIDGSVYRARAPAA